MGRLAFIELRVTVLVGLRDQERGLFAHKRQVTVHLMNILLMASEIATLSEGSIAEIALVGPLRGVLTEVIAQVATLAECGVAVGVLAPEVELALLVVGVSDFDNLMPVVWDSFKMLDIDFGIPTFQMVVTRTGA